MFDVLAVGAHPDDVEIFMGGTILHLKNLSYKVAVCDLTMGEAGTYGNAEIRKNELDKATEMLGIDKRVNLNLEDGNIRNERESRMKVIEIIRKLRPSVVFSFSSDLIRHPDHRYCGEIVKESCYLAGLEKIESESAPHRPYSFIEFPELIINKKPSFIVDITPFREKKIEIIRSYGSQVTKKGEDDKGTKTLIRSNSFWEILKSRSLQAGAMGGVRYGEPFNSTHVPNVSDPVKAFFRKIV
ncbi:MAG: bacillithiol biosynthesis deacetylase BshB1 [Acidobacteriota bacterium]